MTVATPVLRLRDAAFRHPGGAGVTGVSVDVAPGQALAVIGPNGAGKSTLLRGILGLVPLTAGEMRLDGRSDASNGMIGFLPQSVELDPDFPISLSQVVTQGRYRRLGLFRWPGRHDREVVRDALETVGLADLAPRRFGELSGGQRQRGFLAAPRRAVQRARPGQPRRAGRNAPGAQGAGRRGDRVDARPRARARGVRCRTARQRFAVELRAGRRRAHTGERAGVLRRRRGRARRAHARRARPRGPLMPDREYTVGRAIRRLRTWGSGTR
jgi:ABC-type uncharacterized transport system YnjBCD ATPase subunit